MIESPIPSPWTGPGDSAATSVVAPGSYESQVPRRRSVTPFWADASSPIELDALNDEWAQAEEALSNLAIAAQSAARANSIAPPSIDSLVIPAHLDIEEATQQQPQQQKQQHQKQQKQQQKHQEQPAVGDIVVLVTVSASPGGNETLKDRVRPLGLHLPLAHHGTCQAVLPLPAHRPRLQRPPAS
jgi:hypothetical protein